MKSKPSLMKITEHGPVYKSRDELVVPSPLGNPILCDFGEARFGKSTYTDLIQPLQYRAPEVLLRIPWDQKADIWNLGHLVRLLFRILKLIYHELIVQVWTLFEDTHLFCGGTIGEQSEDHVLSEIVSMLGPPPLNFLQRVEKDIAGEYFDSDCNWIGQAEVEPFSLEARETCLSGDAKTGFLSFIRKMLVWEPEKRATAEKLREDPWLNTE